MYLYAGLAFAVLVGFFLFIPFRLILEYRLLRGDDDLRLEIVWLGIHLVRLVIPVLSFAVGAQDSENVEGELPSHNQDDTIHGQEPMGKRGLVEEIQMVQSISRRYRAVFDILYIFAYGKPPDKAHMPLGQPILGYLAASIYPFTRHFERLHWYTQIGLGDAAATAIAVGTLSGIKAAGFSWLQRKVHLDSSKIRWQVVPNYSQRQVDMAVDCILRVNAGHIIITGVANLVRVGITRAFRWKKSVVH